MGRTNTSFCSSDILDLKCSSLGDWGDTKSFGQNDSDYPLNQQIKESIAKLRENITFIFPATGWHFTSIKPDNALIPEKDKWSCIFKYIEKIALGEKLCLSAQNPGCSGAACYFGFKEPAFEAGGFLAEKEKFKKSIEFGNAFYAEIQAPAAQNDYLILERIEDLADNIIPEVVTLWVDATSLSGLVTLANYDRKTNDNVIIPFASGCQSIWTIPYKEKIKPIPKCVIGLVDPAARLFLPHDILSFSMPINRFTELANNISGSFLELNLWKGLSKAGSRKLDEPFQFSHA